MSKYFSMMTESEQLLLTHIVRELDPEAEILEIGSWLMGSARLMAEANLQAHILCVDPFSGPVVEQSSLDYLKDHPEFQGNRTPELARALVKDLDNIAIMPAVSPHNLDPHPQAFDLYFEDGNHDDPLLKANLDYWLPLLKPNGILALHDSNIPDVAAHIARLQGQGWQWLQRVDSLTVLAKPPSGSEAAAENLHS